MAPPLAGLALAFLAAWAAALAPEEPCPVPLVDPREQAIRQLGAGTQTCADILEVLPHFEKLRAKAGFTPDEFQLVMRLDNADNATFFPLQPFYLSVNTGFLTRDPDRGRIVWMVAHELGHALQWRRPEGELYRALRDKVNGKARGPQDPPPELDPEWLAFSRRYEAQADGIAVQLLVEAGYPADLSRQGQESFFGCGNPAPARTHPAPPQRLVNSGLGQELIARHALEQLEDRAFDGSRARAATAAKPAPGATRPFEPVARLEDYDPQGRLLPGRLASADLRIPVPPPDAGAVRGFLQEAAASAVDFWLADPFKAAVDRVAMDNQATEAVLAACGTPEAAELSRRMSAWGWMWEIAENGAVRAAAWLTGKESARGGDAPAGAR